MKRIVIFLSGMLFVSTFTASAAINVNSRERSDLEQFGTADLAAVSNTSSINLNQNQNLTLSGAPGETVTLSLKNFLMSDSSTFTLQGTATTMFVINVRKQFSLSGSAQIVLAGGVQWNNVTFNVLGKKPAVTLSDNSRLIGILNAPRRTVRLSDQATFYGKINSTKLVVSGDAQVVSPEQPPSP